MQSTKYSEIKSTIRNGDIITFSGSWLASRLIRHFTKEIVAHIGITLWLRFGSESNDTLCIIESMEPGGVRIIPLNYALEHYGKSYYQHLMNLEGDQILGDAIVGWAISQWGKPYSDFRQFLSFIFPSFRKIRTILGYPSKIGSDGFLCTELVATALQFCGFDIKDPVLVTPGEFHKFSCLSEPVELIYEKAA